MPLRIEPLPRMAGHLSFMRTPRAGFDDLQPGMVAALGLALDGTGCVAGLSRFSPTALRETSAYFGSHFSTNMKAAMDIDRRRVLDGGLMSGRLVDLGDLCVEGLAPSAVPALVASAVAAVASRRAIPLLLGGDLDLVPAALEGLRCGRPAQGDDTGTPWIQLGGSPPTGRDHTPAARLACTPQTAEPAQSRQPSSPGAEWDAQRLRALPEGSLAQTLGLLTGGRPVFVGIDLGAWAAPWHGAQRDAPFDGLGLREVRRVLTAIGGLPLAGVAITGLDATRSGLSTVKTGQRLVLTALLDLLYQRLTEAPAAHEGPCGTESPE